MKIAVHAAWDAGQPVAEAEIFQRMAIAAARLGWTCCRTGKTREIEAFAPDVVLAEHFRVAKLTAYPTLGLLWNPPAFWEKGETFIRNVISYDGHLFADARTARFVGDLASALPVRLVQGRWFPTCQATELPAGRRRRGLAYLQTRWDRERHRKVLERIEQKGELRRFGAHATSEPSDPLPFDGVSVLSMLAKRSAALCLHSPQHRRTGTPSARVFEAAAAGAVIIADSNDFIRDAFGDAALYVDGEAPPQDLADAVARHLAWIEQNLEAAEEMRGRAHRIFSERYTFESLLKPLPDLVAQIRDAWRPPAAMAARSVTYIVRAGGRDNRFLDRTLTALERQTHGKIHVTVAAYTNAEAIRRYLASRGHGLAKLDVIAPPDSGLRSTSLWEGLRGVDTEFYGILDDDDTLLPNHVAACLATLDAFPEIDLAFAGTIGVREDDSVAEPRDVLSFSRFDAELFRQRNEIYSNAWLARRSTLARVGADPELPLGEDYYLLLRLQRGANFAPTWRLTAEYRRRISDPTHSRLEDLDKSVERIKRRFHFAPSPFGAPSAASALAVIAENDQISARIFRQMLKRRYARKGLAVYLGEVAALPARLRRLPSILRHGGIEALVRRIARRGAVEYDRRASDQIKPDR